MEITFSFTLNKRYIKHLKDMSYYNHNYYELDLSYYGDYIVTEKCNILYEECDDCGTYAYYSLGYLDENKKFQAMWTWLEDTYKKLNYKETPAKKIEFNYSARGFYCPTCKIGVENRAQECPFCGQSLLNAYNFKEKI